MVHCKRFVLNIIIFWCFGIWYLFYKYLLQQIKENILLPSNKSLPCKQNHDFEHYKYCLENFLLKDDFFGLCIDSLPYTQHHHFKHPKYCIENVSLKHFKHHKEEKTFFLETERSSFWIVQHSAARGMAETRIGNFLLTSFNNDQWAILQKHKK